MTDIESGGSADEREMAAAPPVALVAGAPLEPPTPDHRPLSASVAHDGRRLEVWTTGGWGEREDVRSDGTVGRYRFRDGSPADILIRVTGRDGAETRTLVPSSTIRFPRVDVLPDDRFVLVDSRVASDASGGGRPNGLVVSADGGVIRRFTLADGIADVQTSPSGAIWVSYFDEGIYGGSPGSVSKHGMARFDDSGNVEWVLEVPPGQPSVDDVYALNVTGEVAWSCYYSGFPILRVQGDALTFWSNTATGPGALLVGGDTVALVGGYGAYGLRRLAVGTLAGDALVGQATLRLTMPDGSPVPRGSRVIGRGSDLHVATGGRWHHLSLDRIVEERGVRN